MKKIKQIVISILCLCFVQINQLTVHAKSKIEQWDGKLIAEVFDYGTDITKIVFQIKGLSSIENIDIETFKVSVIQYSTDPMNKDEILFNGERLIQDIYTSSKETGETKGDGEYLVIELSYGYEVSGAKVLHYSSGLNYPIRSEYTLSQEKPFILNGETIHSNDITFVCNETLMPSIDSYGEYTSKSGISYRQYTPKNIVGNKPLIIWLHGGAEGGNNNTVTLLASKSGSTLASQEIQKIFDGAYIVIPQSPSYWSQRNIYNKSVYLDQMQETINEIININPQIDKERIYIGGTSSGGFMTWQLLTADPNLYAGAILASAAYSPTDEEINLVKDIPIWFIHSENDEVIPIEYTDHTVKRLKEKNANTVYTRYSTVSIDEFEYDGHWTFIPLFNNLPMTEDQLTIMEWLSNQKKEPSNNNSRFLYFGSAVILGACFIGGIFYFKKKA